MGKYKVIVTARSFAKADDQALRLLEEHDCDVVRLVAGVATFDEQIKEEIAAADAVIAGLDEYSKELIDLAGKLKVISRYGVGYDKVDVEAADRKGILVTITPGANGDSVADLAVTLMLDAARNVAAMDAAMKGRAQARPQGVEMWQKTLGVIGTGRIGQGVARRCKGFDMKILCYDIYENEAFKKECNAKYVDLSTLLKESDFITIHSPLTPETKDMIGAREFDMMKNDAVIVNTAHAASGAVLPSAALLKRHCTKR